MQPNNRVVHQLICSADHFKHSMQTHIARAARIRRTAATIKMVARICNASNQSITVTQVVISIRGSLFPRNCKAGNLRRALANAYQRPGSARLFVREYAFAKIEQNFLRRSGRPTWLRTYPVQLPYLFQTCLLYMLQQQQAPLHVTMRLTLH